jgi:oxygen-independent coproporphyrinogen-3 oxidase
MEITLEANPGTLEAIRFAAYREAGINRLSLGVQSLNPHRLHGLGRIHGPGQAVAAVGNAREAGFGNLNLDLMFGLPYQTLAEAREDIERALALEPDHLSYYQLTLEPNTAFFKQPPPLPRADLMADMQQQAEELIATAGFSHYEVSAYAQLGRACQHNLNYWRFGDYLGIGAGAHGKLTREHVDSPAIEPPVRKSPLPSRERDQLARRSKRRPAGVERCWKRRHPEAYLRGSMAGRFVSGRYRLDAADLVLEFMMNNLRLHQGFTRSLFESRTGLPFTAVAPLVNEAVARGLLMDAGEHLKPTELGRRFLNDLLELFMPPPTDPNELYTD